MDWSAFLHLLPVYLGTILTLVLLLVTIKDINASRTSAASHATFEFLNQENLNPSLIETRKRYGAILAKETNLAQMLIDDTLSPEEDRCLADIVNRWELFSIGLLNGGLCEKVAKAMHHNRVVDDWFDLREFIFADRKICEDDRIGVNFQKVAENWMKDKR